MNTSRTDILLFTSIVILNFILWWTELNSSNNLLFLFSSKLARFVVSADRRLPDFQMQIPNSHADSLNMYRRFDYAALMIWVFFCVWERGKRKQWVESWWRFSLFFKEEICVPLSSKSLWMVLSGLTSTKFVIVALSTLLKFYIRFLYWTQPNQSFPSFDML